MLLRYNLMVLVIVILGSELKSLEKLFHYFQVNKLFFLVGQHGG